MKNDGFTILEMLVWLLVIAIFTIIALNMGRKTFATSLRSVTDINDEEIFLAAEKYVNDGNVTFNNSNYTCISTNVLREKGYLQNIIGKNRLIEVRINKLTKDVEYTYYVESCN